MIRKTMLVCAAALGLVSGAAATAQPAGGGELAKVLQRLDASAAEFHSTSADFEFDTVQTDPIPDKQVQKGAAYYERQGTAFKMAAHINSVDGKPAVRIYSYTGGVLQLFEGGNQNQVTRFKKAGQYESYLMLGFGASGKDLEQKWNIRYLGPEMLAGVRTEKLELVAKDPTVRKNIPKVTIWVDPARAVSLKQVFDQGPEGYRTCVYFNIKVNQALPKDAFALPTNSRTTYQDR